MPLPVLQALLREMATARQEKGVSYDRMKKEFGADPRKLTGLENVRRLPESSKTDPGGGLAQVVDTYSAATGRDPLDLWSAAIERAKRERTAYEEWLKAGCEGPHPMRPTGDRSSKALGELHPPPEP